MGGGHASRQACGAECEWAGMSESMNEWVHTWWVACMHGQQAGTSTACLLGGQHACLVGGMYAWVVGGHV